MRLLLIVGAGSFFGGMFRYLLSLLVQGKSASVFPWGTLTVNIIGCFLIGCLYGLSEKWNLAIEPRLFLITGLLGGFTTFSAFSAETSHLIKSGQILYATIYVAASVVVGLGMTFLGAWIFKYSPPPL